MNVKTLVENLAAFEEDAVYTMAVTQNRRPLTSAHSYYRSKIYNVELDINPLIQAAAPLFTLAFQCHQKKFTDFNQLHQNLIHEIKAFENLAQQADYSSHEILAARYALCCLLDETISKSSTTQQEAWQKHSLLATFQREHYGGERFFLILQRSLEDAKQHIDLLELFYLCLRYEYQGKYMNLPGGYQELTKLTHTLYQAIRYQRGEFSKQLSITQPTTKTPHYKQTFLLIIIIVMTTIMVGAGAYAIMQYDLYQNEHYTISVT